MLVLVVVCSFLDFGADISDSTSIGFDDALAGDTSVDDVASTDDVDVVVTDAATGVGIDPVDSVEEGVRTRNGGPAKAVGAPDAEDGAVLP